MTEHEIFLAALEIDDPARRAEYLEQSCAGDELLRKQVDALLEAHERSGEFLDVPVLKQMSGSSQDPTDGGETSAEAEAGECDLSFLEPATAPGAIGRLRHYEVRSVIGRGGCGIVLKAFDEKLERIVAIKVMAPELAATSPARKRFLREARATAAVRHENVVSIYAVEEQPLPFLVMEYVDGETLQQRLDRTGPLELRELLRIGQQIACGLSAAHAKGLIHRDIKPGNILLENGADRVKITDFGLARSADDASVTQSGVIAGTPLYMSPEQALGQTIDTRSDLFSLGSVLYVMCSGRPPFRASTTMAVLMRVAKDSPRPIQEIIPESPNWLIGIIAKLHSKQPDERFASAQEASELLGRCLAELDQNGKVEAGLELLPTPAEAARAEEDPDSGEPPVVKDATAAPTSRQISSPRHRRWVVAAALALAALGGLGMTEATGVTDFRGTVIRLFSPEGTLIVEVAEPDVSVSIDGEELVITGAGVKEIRLKPGQHEVLASKDGEVFQQELVTVTANGRPVVTVKKEAAPSIQLSETASDGGEMVAAPEWTSLFDGKSLTGWTTAAGGTGNWRVVDGAITCVGPQDFLYSTRDDFGDFHLRVEAKLNAVGDSGIFFRATKPRSWLIDYEAQITNSPNKTPPQSQRTGSLQDLAIVRADLVPPDTWFTFEIEAIGNHIMLSVNGEKTADYVETRSNRRRRGHLALQHHDPQTRVWFRKIEIKEVKAAAPKAGPTDSPRAPVDPKLRQAYKTLPGEWRIDGGELLQETRFSDCRLVFGDFAWTDYDFVCEAKMADRNHREMHLLYRVSGAGENEFVLCGFYNKRDAVGGSRQGRWLEFAGRNTALEPDRWYKLLVRVRGEHGQCFVDDQLVFDYHDSQSQDGAVGFFTHGPARFRNIRVTDPAGKVLFDGMPKLPASADEWFPSTEPPSASELLCLKGHGAPVFDVSFSPDGRRIISASRGRCWGDKVNGDGSVVDIAEASTLRLWDSETGRELDRAPIRLNPWGAPFTTACKFAWEPSSARFITGFSETSPPDIRAGTRRWAIEGDKLKSELLFPELFQGAPSLSFTQEGRKVLAVWNVGHVYQWDAIDGTISRKFSIKLDDATCCAITPNGRLGLVARRNQPIAEIDLSAEKETGRWQEQASVRSMAFSRDSARLVTGGYDGTVRLWDVTNAKELCVVGSHSHGNVDAVAISPDGKRAITGGGDWTVRLWDLEAPKELAHFSGHTGTVQAVAFSPDGTRAVSGSDDYTVRVWRLPPEPEQPSTEAKEIPAPSAFLAALRRDQIPPAALTFAGNGDPKKAPPTLVAVLGEPEPIHTRAVVSMAYSPDRRWLASRDLDNMILLREADTGKLRRVLRDHPNGIMCVGFSPDSRTLVAGDWKGTVKLWSTEDEEEPTAVPLNVECTQMAVSPDGRFLVAGGRNGKIWLWNWDQWEKPLELPVVSSGSLAAIAFSSDGELVACGWRDGESDREVGLYKTADGTLNQTLPTGKTSITCLSLSPDKKRLASVGGGTKLWDLGSAEADEIDLYGNVYFSQDSQKLVILGFFGGRVYDASTCTLLEGVDPLTYHAYGGMAFCAAFSPDGKTMVIGDSWGAMNFYDTTNWQIKQKYLGTCHHSAIVGLAVSGDGRSVLSRGLDKTLRRWDVAAPQERQIVRQFRHPGGPLAYGPDGKTFAASESPLFVWDAASGKQLFATSKNIWSLAYSPDGKTIVGQASWEHVVRMWDVGLGREVYSFPPLKEGGGLLAFSPDGRLLARFGDQGTMVVWNAKTGAEVAKLDVGKTSSAAFQPGGDLATGYPDGTIYFWDIVTWTKKRTLRAHSTPISSLTFTPDGKTLLSSGNEGVIQVRNPEHERPRAVIPVGPAGTGYPVTAPVVFALDASGQYLFASGPTNVIYVHRLSLDDGKRTEAPRPAPSALLDDLRREQISPAALTFAGNGDPKNAPPSLVAVLGEPEPIHTGGVGILAFSPDGRWLATGGSDGSILLRQAATGKVHRVLREASFLGFTPDSQTVVATSREGAIQLWSIDEEQAPTTVLTLEIERARVAVSPDGRFLAAGGRGGFVKLWKWGQWDKPMTLPVVSTGDVFRLAFSFDGELLTCGWMSDTTQNPIGLYQTADAKLKQVLPGHKKYIECLCFSPDGKYLASTEPWNGTQLWDLVSGAAVASFPQAWRIGFSPNGTKLVNLGDYAGAVYDVSAPTEGKAPARRTIGDVRGAGNVYSGFPWWASFSPDGKTLAIGDNGGAVNLFDTDDWQLKKSYSERGHHSCVTALAVSPDGSSVLSRGMDVTLRRWDPANSDRPRLTLQFMSPKWNQLAYSPDGKTFATGDYQGFVVWNAKTNEELYEESVRLQGGIGLGPGGPIQYAPDGQFFAFYLPLENQIALWDVRLRKQVYRFIWRRNERTALAFTADGSLLAAGSESGDIAVWHVKSGNEVAAWKDEKVHSVAFRPNGQVLATGHADGAIKLWSTTTWQNDRTLSAHKGAVTSLKYAPDGRLLVSSGTDGLVQVRNPDWQRPLTEISVGPAGPPVVFDLDASGHYLFASGPTNVIYVHRLPLDDWAEMSLEARE